MKTPQNNNTSPPIDNTAAVNNCKFGLMMIMFSMFFPSAVWPRRGENWLCRAIESSLSDSWQSYSHSLARVVPVKVVFRVLFSFTLYTLHSTPSASRMRCIVDVAFDLPQVLGHRAAAARRILLRFERNLVGRDLRQVLATVSYCRRNRCETLTNI